MSENEVPKRALYRVTNRTTGIVAYKAAPNAADACVMAGWDVNDCYVQKHQPEWKKDEDHTRRLLVKVPCNVCPFQYAQCAKPSLNNCPVHISAADFTQWLKQVGTAHLCDYVGKSLEKKDHELHQVWLTIEDAIRLLTTEN